MRRLVTELNTYNLEDILCDHHVLQTGSANVEEVCAWNGSECDERESVTSINCMYLFAYALAIEWLPPNLQSVNITFYASPFQRLNTRMLPRELRDCIFSGCKLTGGVDLRTLPSKIETINLSGNSH